MRIFLLTLLVATILTTGKTGAEVTVSLNAEYVILNPELTKDIFTLRFKNINESSPVRLHIVLPPLPVYGEYSIRDRPFGYFNYKVMERDGRQFVVITIDKTLSPSETYHLTIQRDLPNLLDKLESGLYRFTAIEYPEAFIQSGIGVDSVRISLKFPEEFFYAYRILSVSSNSKIYYNSLNSVSEVEWTFVTPRNQVFAYVEFGEVINFFTLNIVGASLTAVAFFGLLFLSYRAEKKYQKMGIIPSTPWSGEIVARMKEMFKNAKEEVLITSPHIYYTDWLTAELKPLIDRGVSVRIITWPSFERRQFKSLEEVYEDKKQYFTLKRFLEMFPKGTVKLNDNIHAKLVIVDRREVFLTTANLTQTGLFENYEVGFWAENEELAKQAVEFFNRVWESPETIDLDEESLDAKIAWAEIMERKNEVRGEENEI
jgi:cardiolipin synthase